MPNDLIDPNDLAHLPGAPFSYEEIDAAVSAVRAAAGWHIAPSRAETKTLDVQCYESLLRLPTRALTSVTAVRDTDTAEVIASTKYRISKSLGQVVHKTGYWPAGYGRVEVDMTHGFATAPADLLVVIAEAATIYRREGSMVTQSAGPFRVTYGEVDYPIGGINPLSKDSVLARYSLWQPGIA
jgi:hypothetical protein